MLYLDDKPVRYPSRGILSDAVLRSCSTTDSYSPINSEILDIIKYWVDVKRNAVIASFDFSKFDSYHKYNDISARVAKHSSESKDLNATTITVEDWETLTPKAIKTFESYFQQVLWGMAYKDVDLQRNVNNTVGYKTSQTNSGEIKTDVTEDVISDDEDYEDIVDYTSMHIKSSKLVYYIKLINELSIQKSINILQILVLRKRYGGNISMMMADGIERIDNQGGVFTRYASSYSRSNTWKQFWDWFTSEDYSDMWLRIINKFLLLCDDLRLDIGKQDWTLYSVSNMANIVCTYFESNMDFVNNVGRFDPIVAAAIDSAEIFKLKTAISGLVCDWDEAVTESNIPDLYQELLMSIQYDLFNIRELTSSGKRELQRMQSEIRLLSNKKSETDKFISTLYVNFGFPTEKVNKLLNIDNTGFYYYLNNNTNSVTHLKLQQELFKKYLIFNSPPTLYVTENGILIWPILGKVNSFRYCTIEEVQPMLVTGGMFPDGICKDI